MSSESFTGYKLALIYSDKLLVYKRDNYTTVPFPGKWDLPGGGRELQETPQQCVLRELEEEFAITLPQSRLLYRSKDRNHNNTGYSFFFAALALRSEIDAISFGDEGQYWKLMTIDEYLVHPEGIVNLQARLARYLEN